ncbi:uncharacterized protein [Phaseolus vulgaris]|uniref:uncharacterized protein n=1 Tax=Phaseolus vulgaris TaxID=3885 RepID=UPI0035CAEE23
MDKVLAPMLGRNVQAYVDDMVVTSLEKNQHIADLEELFVTIAKYKLKLNPEKCIFGVEAGKFLGFLLTERGIEANPDKCVAILAMRSPATVKDVQQLTGQMAALSRFVSASGERGHPYFQCLKRNNRFVWTKECEEAFVKLKEYLASPPVLCKPQLGVPLRLYFAVTEKALSAVLVLDQDQIQKLVYFVSKVLQGPEVRYQALEKAALALGSGAGIILEGPNGVLIEQSLKFTFKASNNQAEYEALIAGVLLAKEMGARVLLAKSDSLLFTGQVTGEFQAKDLQMAAYLDYVQELRKSFASFEVVHVPREQNARADLLAKLASSGKGGRQRTVIQETLKIPRAFVADHQVLQICKSKEGMARGHKSLSQETLRTPRIRAFPVGEIKMTQVCAVHELDTWITPYQRYMADGVLPMDPTEARKSGTHETPFSLVYGCDAMIPIEIQESSPRFQNFVAEDSNAERRMNLDLLDEVREEARVKAEAIKRRVERKYNSRTRPRQFRDGDLVMRKAHLYEMQNKLSPKWTGPFRITEALGNAAYRLETLEGGAIPRTWNATHLKFQYS